MLNVSSPPQTHKKGCTSKLFFFAVKLIFLWFREWNGTNYKINTNHKNIFSYLHIQPFLTWVAKGRRWILYFWPRYIQLQHLEFPTTDVSNTLHSDNQRTDYILILFCSNCIGNNQIFYSYFIANHNVMRLANTKFLFNNNRVVLLIVFLH